MRRYQTLIQEAELMALPPETVARFLKQRSRHKKRIHNASDPVDREVEESLLGRNEPLIDLALARYSLYAETVASLFSAAAPDSGLRIACLSNDVIGQVQFNNFPLALFGSVPAMLDWLAGASDQEFSSLFENPALDDSFLVDLLERRHDWQALPEEKLVRIASALTRNPRMTTSRLDTWTDGYADYLYGAVFAAAWKLAWSIDPSDTSAFALGQLYERLLPEGVAGDGAVAIAGRWRAPAGSQAAKREGEDNDRGLLGLSDWQRVRKGLARLAVSQDRGLFETLIASDDIAFRCAAYAAGDMPAEQIEAAFERDGGLAYYELLNNPRHWRTPSQRRALAGC